MTRGRFREDNQKKQRKGTYPHPSEIVVLCGWSPSLGKPFESCFFIRLSIHFSQLANKSIPLPRDGLNKPRLISVILKDTPYLSNSEVETLLIIDVSICTPDFFYQLLSGQNRS